MKMVARQEALQLTLLVEAPREGSEGSEGMSLPGCVEDVASGGVRCWQLLSQETGRALQGDEWMDRPPKTELGATPALKVARQVGGDQGNSGSYKASPVCQVLPSS